MAATIVIIRQLMKYYSGKKPGNEADI